MKFRELKKITPVILALTVVLISSQNFGRSPNPFSPRASDGALRGDFDGDGIADFLLISQDLKWDVKIGATGKTQELWMRAPQGTFRYLIGDFNGDRKDDVLYIEQSSNSWNLALSTGINFIHYPEVLNGQVFQDQVSCIFDEDKDGVSDVILNSQTKTCAKFNGSIFQITTCMTDCSGQPLL